MLPRIRFYENAWRFSFGVKKCILFLLERVVCWDFYTGYSETGNTECLCVFAECLRYCERYGTNRDVYGWRVAGESGAVGIGGVY